jgi:hypothetical protein
MVTPSTKHFELYRNWVLGGYSSEFSVTFELKQHLVSQALDLVLRTMRIHLCPEGALPEDDCRELRNIKGRDPHESPLVPGAPSPAGEEILTIGGTIATGTTANNSDTSDFVWEPFHYSCHSRFDRFEGSRTIVHSVHTQRAATLPEWLPWWLLGAAAPIEPQYFRLGLEFFTSRFVITRLSFTPVVTDTFLIDCVDTTLSLKLRTEQPYWKPCNPFGKIALLRSLATGLETITGVSLPNLFARELSERGNLPPRSKLSP